MGLAVGQKQIQPVDAEKVCQGMRVRYPKERERESMPTFIYTHACTLCNAKEGLVLEMMDDVHEILLHFADLYLTYITPPWE